MKRLLLAVAAALLVTTGCGTVHTAGSGSGAEASPAVESSPADQRTKAQAQAAARHDQLFPDVAARCAGVIPSPSGPFDPSGSAGSATPSSGTADGADPAAKKYAENHAFKMTVNLDAPAQCRGDAHAARIAAALERQKPGRASTLTEQELQSALEALGYPKDSTQVYRSGGAVTFSLFVPATGPCVTGRLDSPLNVKGHGPYMEGGCTEPKGGH